MWFLPAIQNAYYQNFCSLLTRTVNILATDDNHSETLDMMISFQRLIGLKAGSWWEPASYLEVPSHYLCLLLMMVYALQWNEIARQRKKLVVYLHVPNSILSKQRYTNLNHSWKRRVCTNLNGTSMIDNEKEKCLPAGELRKRLAISNNEDLQHKLMNLKDAIWIHKKTGYWIRLQIKVYEHISLATEWIKIVFIISYKRRKQSRAFRITNHSILF